MLIVVCKCNKSWCLRNKCQGLVGNKDSLDVCLYVPFHQISSLESKMKNLHFFLSNNVVTKSLPPPFLGSDVTYWQPLFHIIFHITEHFLNFCYTFTDLTLSCTFSNCIIIKDFFPSLVTFLYYCFQFKTVYELKNEPKNIIQLLKCIFQL